MTDRDREGRGGGGGEGEGRGEEETGRGQFVSVFAWGEDMKEDVTLRFKRVKQLVRLLQCKLNKEQNFSHLLFIFVFLDKICC